MKTTSVWMPAQARYDLIVAAGGKPKPPKYPGQIVTMSRARAAILRVKANLLQAGFEI
jgi:hypothetical protein